jgi:hypothetical protein
VSPRRRGALRRAGVAPESGGPCVCDDDCIGAQPSFQGSDARKVRRGQRSRLGRTAQVAAVRDLSVGGIHDPGMHRRALPAPAQRICDSAAGPLRVPPVDICGTMFRVACEAKAVNGVGMTAARGRHGAVIGRTRARTFSGLPRRTH